MFKSCDLSFGYKYVWTTRKQPLLSFYTIFRKMEVDIMPSLRQARRGEIHPNRNAMPGKCTLVHTPQTFIIVPS